MNRVEIRLFRNSTQTRHLRFTNPHMHTSSGYVLVQNAAGELIGATGGKLAATASGDDSCLWRHEGNHLVHVSGLVRMRPNAYETSEVRSLTLDDDTVLEGGPFRLVDGPEQTPSAHLKELREQGFTVVRNVMDCASITRLKAEAARVRAERHAHESSHDGIFWMMDPLLWSVDVARAAAHPVALWIVRQYMETEEIHFCHQPVLTTAKPADLLRGTFPEKGWHSDYPYHSGVFPQDIWPEHPVFGVQFNVCVDAFREDNAATQYLPGSHLRGMAPTTEFNTGGTRMGRGRHAGVRQWLAPAGSGLIYDARMWHRACIELNISGRDRLAVLNAVAPAFVRPMMDKRPLAEAFAGAPAARGLSGRERVEIERLCCAPTRPTPPGMPRLAYRAYGAKKTALSAADRREALN